MNASLSGRGLGQEWSCMTPTLIRYANRPPDRLYYGKAETDWGIAYVVASERGLCWMALGDEQDEEALLEGYRSYFSPYRLMSDARVARDWVGEIGRLSAMDAILHVKATPFQSLVWRALRFIPWGGLLSYAALAEWIGHPLAVRAVASAVARNPVAWFVPCHRIIRSDDLVGEYRWGYVLKERFLEHEKKLQPFHFSI